MAALLNKIKVKDMEVKNRIVMAPMCMYSAEQDGIAKEWHVSHYETRAVGGVGLIIQEATGVTENGRISDRDLGIWSDRHMEGLSKIVYKVKKAGAKIGIQLGHAGRKCEISQGEIIAPSEVLFSEEYQVPREMTKQDIEEVIAAFKEGARRAFLAGYDFIEIHGAHGYLINQFLSPITNLRTDEYGGSLEKRARFLGEVIEAIRSVWPEEKPLGLRITAEDYHEEGNHKEDLAQIINLVKDKGLDVIDVSTGGMIPDAVIQAFEGYQITYAEYIKEKTGLLVMAGGLVISPEMAEEIIGNHRSDFIYLGRVLLREPYWSLAAASKLLKPDENEAFWPQQYLRGISKR